MKPLTNEVRFWKRLTEITSEERLFKRLEAIDEQSEKHVLLEDRDDYGEWFETVYAILEFIVCIILRILYVCSIGIVIMLIELLFNKEEWKISFTKEFFKNPIFLIVLLCTLYCICLIIGC